MYEGRINERSDVMIEELYRLYYKDVYYYILSLCHDQNLSEDLTSDTFYQLMLSQSTFRQQSQIKTWIFSIARHVVYKEFRKMKSIVPYDVSLKSMYYDEYNVYYDEILGYMKELPEVNRIVFSKVTRCLFVRGDC